MGNRKIFPGLFVTLTIYILLLHQKQTAGALNTNLENVHNRLRARPLIRLSPRPMNQQYARIKADLDDDDFFELNKRQTSDDYGHLRFGKRSEDQFDDYGHMRFGRSGANENKKK